MADLVDERGGGERDGGEEGHRRQAGITPIRRVADSVGEWRENRRAMRRIDREAEESRRRIAAAVEQEMAAFHERLWGDFDLAVERVLDKGRVERRKQGDGDA